MRVRVWVLAGCLVLAGCRHRVTAPVAIALPPAAPVPVEPVHAQETVALQPVVTAPVATVKLPKVKRKKKVVVAPAPAAAVPVQVAVAGPVVPSVDVVGALSAGNRGKDAADLLAVVEKRVAALPASVVDGQREQVARVKLFWGEAKRALAAGDSEGAWTLATKAKVLLDDVSK